MSLVPPEITAEVTQILSNLVLGDNAIRASAEKAVNERLAQTPQVYLVALAQFAIAADTSLMRSFSLVLLRRLLFRTSSSPPLYDHLPTPTISTLQSLLLHSLQNEPAQVVRRTSVDTVCDFANCSMNRGRPWHALQALAFAMTSAGIDTNSTADLPILPPPSPSSNGGLSLQMPSTPSQNASTSQPSTHAIHLRESAYRIFAGCPMLIMDLQTNAVLDVLAKGLRDPCVQVRHSALKASVSYLQACDPTTSQLSQSLPLMHPMLETLTLGSDNTDGGAVDTAAAQTESLQTLTPLTTSHPTLFAPHLNALLSFLPQLILPVQDWDCGPTPTVGKPFPVGGAATANGSGGAGGTRQGAFVFPPPSQSRSPGHNGPATPPSSSPSSSSSFAAAQTLRLTALEFMLSISEARPSMVRKVDGWVGVLVRACLEGMGEPGDGDGDGEVRNEEEETREWCDDDPNDSNSTIDADTASPALYEQALDRLACALGGRSVLPPAFQYIPSMMASFDWRVRSAGLMAIAAIAEGTGKVMQNELGKVVDLVTPMFRDPHPRVRYAACQCVGQLCTDLEEIIQEKYHQQLFGVLIPTLEDPEPRVHAHAAAALINFCEGVERDTLLPYLDPIVERLLKLLNPPGDPALVRRYVQEQAITTLAMVADASETTFGKHYPAIMPLLLTVLRNADGPDYRKLRVKAMECAGLIAIAVGREVFRPDANTLVELLMRIQNSPPDPGDTLLGHYLIATWAKICQALGPEFEPYLPVVMPPLLTTASAKADVSVYEEDEDKQNGREGWETISMDGQTVGIRTSAIEEKCQAFETLVIYCSTLGPRFAPYLPQCLSLTLPSLRFFFHDGVREACAMLIPMLLVCGKTTNTLTNEMVSATFLQLINCISVESDSSFLASLFKCFTDSVRVIGGPTALPYEFQEGIMEATKRQLQNLADRRKARAQRPASDLEEDREDMALLEEMEDFALEDMSKMLTCFDSNHTLLIAVSSVRELGFNQWDSEDEGDDDQ